MPSIRLRRGRRIRLREGLRRGGLRLPADQRHHPHIGRRSACPHREPERATVEHLAAYASVAAVHLGGRVAHWATLNEPSGAEGGIVNNLSTVYAATGRCEDEAAARRHDGHVNRRWLDRVHDRGFPADTCEGCVVELPERPGDREGIAAPLDRLGPSCCLPAAVADDPAGPARAAAACVPPSPARRSSASARVWTGRSTRAASRCCCCGSPVSTAHGSPPSPRTALPARTWHALRASSATPSAMTTWSGTCPAVSRRPARAPPGPTASPGRCSTAPSGRTAATGASASSTSTTALASARSGTGQRAPERGDRTRRRSRTRRS